MNYATHPRDFAPCFDHGIAPQRAARKPGLLRRVLGALIGPRRRGADRELNRSLNFSGRAFSDALEREMLEPMSRPKWGRRE
jgi:hypothetical protein